MPGPAPSGLRPPTQRERQQKYMLPRRCLLLRGNTVVLSAFSSSNVPRRQRLTQLQMPSAEFPKPTLSRGWLCSLDWLLRTHPDL